MTDYAIAFGLIMSIGVMLLLAPRVVAHLPVKVNARMTTHLLSGLLLSSLVLLVDNVGALLLAGFLASLGIVVVVEFGWLGSMLSGSRWRDYGFVFYAVGFLASVALYSPDNRAIVAGLVILAVADPLAAAVGRRLGRHTVQVFGARRTIEGSAAFAVATLLVAVLVLAVTGPLTPRALGMALFAAVTSAALELAVPGALDNLVIPLWVGFVFHVDVTIGPLGLEWTTALALAGLLSAVAVRARWLTLSGAAAAFLAGAAALAFGGVAWVLPALVFVATTSVLSKIGGKANRGLEQSIVNGVVPMLPILGYQITGGEWNWYVVHVAMIAVASSDTWASEVGRLANWTPLSMRNLKPVKPGVSGGVTLPGTVASVIGAGLVGAAAVALAPSTVRFELLVAALVIGPAGMFADSLLGAWLQCRYACRQCSLNIEIPSHCGVPATAISGVKGFTNERVNLAANVFGGLMAAAVLAVIA